MIRKIHRVLGLILCLPMIWIACTGSIIAIISLIEQHPAGSSKDLLDGVKALTIPFDQVRSIQWQSEHVLSIESKNGARQAVAVDPPSQPYPILSQWQDLRRSLIRLHRGQFLGDAGRFIFSGFGALFGILIFLSLWLFRRAKRTRSLRDVHQKAAWISFVPLLFTVVTGSIWNLSRNIRALPPVPESAFAPIEALEKAADTYKISRPQAVYATDNRTLVLFADQSRFYWNSVTKAGEMRATWTPGGWIEPLLSLHSGQFWGAFGGVVPLLTGIFAIFMAVSGFIIFRRRRSR